ncbi:MAG: cytochrome c [Deltaproteobacteria bacterium]|nr:cytochrome c [Deltaproteobacteria bacterium]
MRISLSSLALSLALAGCGGGSDTPATDAGVQTRADRVAALTGDVAAGQLQYENNGCSGCHGANGQGTYAGVALNGPMKSDSKVEIINVVLGGKGTNMPAFGSLEDQAVADLYAYMKATFGK